MQITNAAVDTGRKPFCQRFLRQRDGAFPRGELSTKCTSSTSAFPWNLPDYCAEHGITDVLFFNSEMTAHTSFQIDSMNAIFPITRAF